MELQTGSFVDYGVAISAFGLVAWLVRHVTSTTIPGMIEDFKETSRTQLEVFERVNREQRQEFRETLESDRQLHHKREEALRQEFRDAIGSTRKKGEEQ